MDRPTVYYMSMDKLTDFVRNKARPGDIAFSRDRYANREYVYRCTHDNIGEGVEPYWLMLDSGYFLRQKLKSMSLEEKIDFLIDKYISEHT